MSSRSSDAYRVLVAATIAAVPGMLLARDGADGALTAGFAAGIIFGVVFVVLKSLAHRTTSAKI